MKQVDVSTEEWRTTLRNRIVQARREARARGIDPDELAAEAKRVDHEWQVDAARVELNQALREFKAAARGLADAYEDELIDPASLSETWPCWMPSIEDVAADLASIEPLEELPK